jgi:hypothetical protein
LARRGGSTRHHGKVSKKETVDVRADERGLTANN